MQPFGREGVGFDQTVQRCQGRGTGAQLVGQRPRSRPFPGLPAGAPSALEAAPCAPSGCRKKLARELLDLLLETGDQRYLADIKMKSDRSGL
jgi:hypothetical protein